MARGVNKVILVGNLGNDPDLKYTQGGMAICGFSLATSSQRKDSSGEYVERTEWHTVKAFGKLGEIAAEYLAKGRQVYVEGEIRYSKVDGQDGTTKYFTDIVASELQFLGGQGQGEGGGGHSRGGGGGGRGGSSSGRGGGGRQATERQGTQRDVRPRTDLPDDGGGFGDDDIPF